MPLSSEHRVLGQLQLSQITVLENHFEIEVHKPDKAGNRTALVYDHRDGPETDDILLVRLDPDGAAVSMITVQGDVGHILHWLQRQYGIQYIAGG